MDQNLKNLQKSLLAALTGKGAHVEARHVFEGLDWRLAGRPVEGADHSIFQLLNHVIYWQEWALRWLTEEGRPPIPKHASGSWPGSVAPVSQVEWKQTVERFVATLAELSRLSRSTDLFVEKRAGSAKKSRMEMLQTIASHNSYHLGQVVLSRRILGAWPPPSGGLTW